MSWHIDNEFIKEKNGNTVCILFPNIDSSSAMLIKQTPDILSSIMKFRDFYNSKRKITKELYDELIDLVDINANYDFTWQIDQKGDIVDKNNIKICFFPTEQSDNAILIQYVPEMFKAVQTFLPFDRAISSRNLYMKALIEYSRK